MLLNPIKLITRVLDVYAWGMSHVNDPVKTKIAKHLTVASKQILEVGFDLKIACARFVGHPMQQGIG